MFAGFRVDTDGDKGVEGMWGEVRVSFAYSEQLVDVPGDNSTGESAPTPLDNAAEGQWLSEAQFCSERFSSVLPSTFVICLEKVAHEIAGCAGIGSGAEGEQHKGHVQSSRLHLLRADVDQLLYLFGRHIFARPRLLPAWLRRCDRRVMVSSLGGRARPVF